ncbi:MAG: molybdopterin-synthase adenylyltransferase MoeB [Candidatus Hadarchaeaceae archaeon]
MVKVNIKFSALLKEVVGDGLVTIDVEDQTVKGLLAALFERYGPSLEKRVIDEKTGGPRRFINIFVNGKDIRNLRGTDTKLEEGAEVRFLPSVAGGKDFLGFTQEQIVRYSRQIVLPEVGGKGQKKLLRSRVLVIGAGGLGSPALLYLASAGVGRIGIIDSDDVDLSNLQRQIAHTTKDIGRPKTVSALEKLKDVNPEVDVVTFNERLNTENVFNVFKEWDIILDGSDNFSTKFLANDACVLKNIPLSNAGILRFTGMVMTILPHKGPCYRCLTPEAPSPGAIPSCQEAGVIGALPGIVGSIQAAEVIKYLLGIGDLLVGRILVLDALEMRFEEFEIKRNPDCPICGDHPVIRDLSQVDYGNVCEVRW